MGILPIVLPAGMNPDSLNIQPGDTVTIDASPEKLKVRGKIPIQIHRIGGGADRFEAQVAAETMMEIELLKYGGVIPSILQKNIQQ
jgi:aconitate hydratase